MGKTSHKRQGMWHKREVFCVQLQTDLRRNREVISMNTHGGSKCKYRKKGLGRGEVSRGRGKAQHLTPTVMEECVGMF